MVLIKCKSCENIWDYGGQGQYAPCPKCHNKVNVSKNQLVPVFYGYHITNKEGIWNVIRDGETWKLVKQKGNEQITFESQKEFVEFLLDMEESYELLKVEG